LGERRPEDFPMLRFSTSPVPRRRLSQGLCDRRLDVANDKIGRHRTLQMIAVLAF
jgi:hypothetical protein